MTFERNNIAAMKGYVSGEQPDDPNTTKLNTNENPYPPTPEVAKAIASFHVDMLRRYPPPDADGFRDAAATLHQTDRNNIIATRGGDELLRLMITTFVDPMQTIGVTEPTYSLYPVLAHIQNCPITSVPMQDDWKPPKDFARKLNNAGAKLTFLVNPHAPSGMLLAQSQIADIAAELEGVLLLDEAYVDFVDPKKHYDSIPLIKDFENIVILRTLSKGYSLAGQRFGYGIGPEQLIQPMLKKTRDSYNIDWLSQDIASAALKDQAYAKDTWSKVRDERMKLVAGLTQMGFTVAPSEANFLLAAVPLPLTAQALYLDLKKQGILVRYFDHQGLNDKLRITVGTPLQNSLLIEAIAAQLR